VVKVELEHIEAREDEEGRLHILQRFKVDGAEMECEMVFKRYRGRVMGYMLTRKSVEGDRRRLLAYCEAVGLRPSKLEKSPSQWGFSRKDLEALMFREVAETIKKWLSR
jgi:hypothetical protein